MKEKEALFLTEDLLRYMREARRFDTLLADICGLRNADLTELQPLFILMTQDPQRKGLTVQEMAEALSLKRPFLTFLLKNAAEHDYIRKREATEMDPSSDKRWTYITLTDEGEDYCKTQIALFDAKLGLLLDMPRAGHVAKYKDVTIKLEKANAYLIKTRSKM